MIGLFLCLVMAACDPSPTTTSAIAPDAVPDPVTATAVVGVAFVTLAPPTVALLRTTPTPLPSPTATPTPTPIVVQVVEGDTIWVLAARSNRTVEDVLALNPAVRPESLQIGQSLVLPPPATPIFSGGGATPVPLDVAVHSVTPYRTRLGGLWLLGEVVNQGAFAADGVQVLIELLDAAGEAILSQAAWPAGLVLPPGGEAPFGLLLPAAPDDFVHTRVAIVAGQSSLDLGSRYLDLAAESIEADLGEHELAATGFVTNIGDATAGPILLIATFRDAQGRVVGYQQLEFAGPLVPGESMPFDLAAAPPGGRAVALDITVQGLRTEAGP